MNIAFFSDTHSRSDILFPENADIFIHCGDLLESGDFFDLERSLRIWKKGLNGRPMYFVAGNHDGVFETSLKRRAIDLLRENGISYQQDSGIELENGISIWFTPWVCEINEAHSFNLPSTERERYIQKIPNSIDILITHGPPEYILDQGFGGRHYGDPILLNKISSIRSSLKVHAFGHIHQARGVLRPRENEPLFINCAIGEIPRAEPILLNFKTLHIIDPVY